MCMLLLATPLSSAWLSLSLPIDVHVFSRILLNSCLELRTREELGEAPIVTGTIWYRQLQCIGGLFGRYLFCEGSSTCLIKCHDWMIEVGGSILSGLHTVKI